MPTRSADVFRTYIVVGMNLLLTDTIEFRGEMWLVPMWSESRDGGWSRPARIIALNSVGEVHPMMENGRQGFVVSHPVPKALFDDPIPQEIRAAYTVVDRPDIEFLYLPGLS